jgi:hypothetical protein
MIRDLLTRLDRTRIQTSPVPLLHSLGMLMAALDSTRGQPIDGTLTAPYSKTRTSPGESRMP